MASLRTKRYCIFVWLSASVTITVDRQQTAADAAAAAASC